MLPIFMGDRRGPGGFWYGRGKERRWVYLGRVCHTLWMALRFIGMRDRLRCPSCSKVGTWKPHGGILDSYVSQGIRGGPRRDVRRWLCKWCGLYYGPEGIRQAALTRSRDGRAAWSLGTMHDSTTPREMLRLQLPARQQEFDGRALPSVDFRPDPWRG